MKIVQPLEIVSMDRWKNSLGIRTDWRDTAGLHRPLAFREISPFERYWLHFLLSQEAADR